MGAGGTRTPTRCPSAGTTAAGRPSTHARHAGNALRDHTRIVSDGASTRARSKCTRSSTCDTRPGAPSRSGRAPPGPPGRTATCPLPQRARARVGRPQLVVRDHVRDAGPPQLGDAVRPGSVVEGLPREAVLLQVAPVRVPVERVRRPAHAARDRPQLEAARRKNARVDASVTGGWSGLGCASEPRTLSNTRPPERLGGGGGGTSSSARRSGTSAAANSASRKAAASSGPPPGVERVAGTATARRRGPRAAPGTARPRTTTSPGTACGPPGTGSGGSTSRQRQVVPEGQHHRHRSGSHHQALGRAPAAGRSHEQQQRPPARGAASRGTARGCRGSAWPGSRRRRHVRPAERKRARPAPAAASGGRECRWRRDTRTARGPRLDPPYACSVVGDLRPRQQRRPARARGQQPRQRAPAGPPATSHPRAREDEASGARSPARRPGPPGPTHSADLARRAAAGTPSPARARTRATAARTHGATARASPLLKNRQVETYTPESTNARPARSAASARRAFRPRPSPRAGEGQDGAPARSAGRRRPPGAAAGTAPCRGRTSRSSGCRPGAVRTTRGD